MLISPSLLIRSAWIVTAIIWLAATAFAKPTVKTGSPWNRLASLTLAIAGGFCIGDKLLHWGWLSERFLPHSRDVAFMGAGLTVAGCLFAIWARAVLGSNWSGTPGVKQDHVLVQKGPYTITRHPIYTGFLTAVLGTVVAVAQYRAILGLVLVLLSLLLKIGQEEKLMSQTFPQDYPNYRNRVKALVPWVL